MGREDEVIALQLKDQTLPAFRDPEEYARWVFEFLRTDLAAASPRQLLELRANLYAFVRPELLEVEVWNGEFLPSADEVTRCQQLARGGLDRVLKGEWFLLEGEGVRYGIARAGNQIVKGHFAGTFSDLFCAAVMDTIQAFWERLRQCPQCGATFLKIRKQKFCSPACANRAHWEAFKAHRGERDYRVEYANRTQKRLGPNAKVKISSRSGK